MSKNEHTDSDAFCDGFFATVAEVDNRTSYELSTSVDDETRSASSRPLNRWDAIIVARGQSTAWAGSRTAPSEERTLPNLKTRREEVLFVMEATSFVVGAWSA